MRFNFVPWSVRSAIKGDLAKWRAENRHYRRHKMSLLYKQLLFASEHPIRLIVSLVALSVASFFLWRLSLSGLMAGQLRHWTRPLDRFAHFASLWTIQATVSALVFPIVIAFVTIFLQRRAATRAFVQLYIFDSAALVAGLSALLLVVVMAAQYVCIPLLGKKNLLVWAQIDAAWFVFNSALTAYFLFRTIEFLRPEIQQRVLQRYAIGVALPRDIERRYATYILPGAVRQGWIPGEDVLTNPGASGAGVAFFSLGVGKAEASVKRFFFSPRLLHDARFWILRFVISGWLKRAKVASTNAAGQNEDPRLFLPLSIGEEYKDQVELASVEAGPKIGRWRGWLLRLAYVFRRPPSRYHLRVEDILSELEADARESVANRDVAGFDRAYETLVDLHKLLIGASISKDPSVKSWALLVDQNRFLAHSFHLDWVQSYRSIFQSAIDVLEVEPRPLRRLFYLSSYLDGEELEGSPVAMRTEILRLPVLLMFRIAGWWTRRIGEQGSADAGPNKLTRLRPPFRSMYEEVLNGFVGGWEEARDAAEIPGASSFAWANAPEIAAICVFHLEETAKMLLAAVSRGDADAAEWFADVLAKWWGDLRFEEDDQFILYGKTEFLTLEHLGLPWPELLASIGIEDGDSTYVEGGERGLQRSVFILALKNYWTDIRTVIVELLLSWAASSQSTTLKNSLATLIAVGFLQDKEWRPGGNQSDGLNEIGAAQYLRIKLRQAVGGTEQHRYVSRIDRFIESVKEMRRPDMVSGRVYHSVGAVDLGSLSVPQLVFLTLLSDREWQPGETLLRQLDIWVSNERFRNRARSILQRWRNSLNESRPPQWFLEALLLRLHKEQGAETRIARVDAVLASLLTYLEEQHAVAVAQAMVDQGRLDQIATFASRLGFTAETGDFPLQLFNDVIVDSRDAEPHTLTIAQFGKGQLTELPLEPRSVNEADSFAKQMASHVGLFVLRDVLSAVGGRDVVTPDADTYWAAIKQEATQIVASGDQPILILGNATTPEWVWQWGHPAADNDFPRPADLTITKSRGRGDGYLCDFNDIHVYVAPLPRGQSVLLGKSAFDRLRFKQLTDGRFVTATTESREDTSQLVDLKLQFECEVRVGGRPCIRLIYQR